MFISDGASSLLRSLYQGRRPCGAAFYPPKLKGREQEIRVSTSETIACWFKRCVEILGEDVFRYRIEENIAFFAIVKWNNNKVNYINLQVLVTKGGSLQDFYLDDTSVKYQYHRLDLDYSSKALFKEAFPHLHSHPNGPPRFFFDYRESNNVIVDFIEFIYLNYRYDNWLKWAESVWKHNASKRFNKDTFPVIKKAFKENQIIPVIERYKDDLKILKNILKREKEKTFQFNVDNELLKILNYN